MVGIKDMEMPKSCLDCPISHEDEIDYYICGKTGKNVYLYTNDIHPDCPLVKIVTCKDCTIKQFDKSESDEVGAEKYYCPIVSKYVDETPNFYCADGKRRE